MSPATRNGSLMERAVTVIERLLREMVLDGPLVDLRVGTSWTLAVVETPQGNPAARMKWLLGTCTSRFNRRHRLFGRLSGLKLVKKLRAKSEEITVP